jgi:23S rRNA (cytidine2498-2'-O)-methyltransferase
MIDRGRVVLTCDAESDGVAWQELRKIFPSLPLPDWLDTGDAVQGTIFMVESGVTFDEFAEQIEKNAPVFIRHIAPVHVEMALTGGEEDIIAFESALPSILTLFDTSKTFAVQSRILGDGKLPYRKVVLNETLSNAIELHTGAVMDCREPQQVVSVLCTPSTGYMGLSLTEQNRSAWPGGKHRFKRDEGQISRAEFKLLEAVSVFQLTLPAEGRALDIGASPGGWTRLLAENGLQVDAVDPGDLDDRLRGNPRVTHIRKRAQDFLPIAKQYSIIVNDMKMDARASISLMLQAQSHLTPGGIAVMTLKMPRMAQSAKGARTSLAMVHSDLHHLSRNYIIRGARQLYHNRNEVTVALEVPNA